MAALTPLASILSLASTAVGLASTGVGVARQIANFGDGSDTAAQAAQRQAAQAAEQARQREEAALARQRQALEFDTQQQTLEAEAARLPAVAEERRQDVLAAQAEADRTRQDALRRAIARRRAALGGAGIGADGGSGEAMLLGLTGTAAAEGAAQADETRRKLAAIGSDLDYRQGLNLLEQSRLAGRRQLAALSGLDTMF